MHLIHLTNSTGIGWQTPLCIPVITIKVYLFPYGMTSVRCKIKVRGIIHCKWNINRVDYGWRYIQLNIIWLVIKKIGLGLTIPRFRDPEHRNFGRFFFVIKNQYLYKNTGVLALDLLIKIEFMQNINLIQNTVFARI